MLKNGIARPRNMLQSEMSRVSLKVALDTELWLVLARDSVLCAEAAVEITAKIDLLMTQLGLGGDSIAHLAPVDEAMTYHQPMRVWINNHLCRYPDELLNLIISYIDGIYPHYSFGSHTLSDWLQSALTAEKGSSQPTKAARFFGIACAEIAKLQPQVLIVGAATIPLPVDVLARTLAMRISVADAQNKLARAKSGSPNPNQGCKSSESLISMLRPRVVEIGLPAADLRRLTTNDIGRAHGCFSLYRELLENRYGPIIPDFRFVTSTGLVEGSFQFRINHLTTPPRTSLPQDKVMANIGCETAIREGLQAEPIVHPFSGVEIALIPTMEESRARELSVSTWNNLEYIMLCLQSEIRAHIDCFIDTNVVAEQLESSSIRYPLLVKAVRDKVPDADIVLTRALRLLVAEGVPICNLNLILNRVLDFDWIVADEDSHIVLDDRVPALFPPSDEWLADPRTLNTFLRTGLRRHLTNSYQTNDRLIAYLIDKDLEMWLANTNIRSEPITESDQDKVISATRRTVSHPYEATILTYRSARTKLREILALELPRVSVIAYSDLTEDAQIVPLERISV
jgi:flagellar biosynthesis component FlhA